MVGGGVGGGRIWVEHGYGSASADARAVEGAVPALATAAGAGVAAWSIEYGGQGYPGGVVAAGTSGAELASALSSATFLIARGPDHRGRPRAGRSARLTRGCAVVRASVSATAPRGHMFTCVSRLSSVTSSSLVTLLLLAGCGGGGTEGPEGPIGPAGPAGPHRRHRPDGAGRSARRRRRAGAAGPARSAGAGRRHRSGRARRSSRRDGARGSGGSGGCAGHGRRDGARGCARSAILN